MIDHRPDIPIACIARTSFAWKTTITLLLFCYGSRLHAQADADLQAMAAARKEQTEILSKRHNLRDQRVRSEIVRRMQAADAARQAAVRRRARARNLPLEGDTPDGGHFRLIDFDENDLPVYEQTENRQAAISTATNLVRSTSPFDVAGTGVKIGLWESGGIPRISHQDLTGRATIDDSTSPATTTNHATHVAGTLAAAGINSSALGMAPAALLSCRNSASDETEMTAVGAASPGGDGIFLSNHSYGAAKGWEGSVFIGTFTNDGNPANDVEADFGRYSDNAAQWDGIAYNLPYYQIFLSAGNHRNDNSPAPGATWTYGGTSYTYDPAQHPKGDGTYKDGYDNLEGNKMAKNVIVVGSVADASLSGVRNVGRAVISDFSSWGPADDGRIKPDIVANGDSVFSSSNSSDTGYSYLSGTSMASPNACGSAALLVNYHASRFPNSAMAASTLKGLILHTADDLFTPGPDYQTGWGLMNTEAAAHVIRLHADNTGGAGIIESSVSTTNPSRTFTNDWDGTTPLRVTLAWTDPAGPTRTGNDNRDKVLVNDLNLTVTRVGGSTHHPYVMPYVGDWTNETIASPAITGVNTVDNIEQVYLWAPTAGTYLITVDHTGTLTNGLQDFSLILSGETNPLDGVPVSTGDQYTEIFDGGGGPINGKTTTTGNGKWIANSIVADNGVCSASAGSAVLPFDPVPNRIYTLSMDFNHISTADSWTGLGFCSARPAAAIGSTSNSDRFTNNPTGYAWMLYNQLHQVVTYEGPKASTTTNGGGGPYSNGVHNMKVVLNTTGDGSSFKAEYFIDGVSINGGPLLIDATTVEGINYVGFTQTTGSTSSIVDNFSLTSSPVGDYAGWATENDIDGEPATDDFDKDGLANLVEYALGLDPTASSGPPGTLIDGILSFTKGSDAMIHGDVTYAIEESDDLGLTDPWEEVTPDVNDDATISYQLPSGPGQPKVFARLKVIQTP